MNEHLTVLPASVIDVAAQTKTKSIRKKGEGNFNDSSRKVKSHHPKEVSQLVYELFLRDQTVVFDPFAGFGQRHFWAKHYGFNYVGYDISHENILFAEEEYGVRNLLADSLLSPLPSFNAVYTCPPYWDLEVYEGEKGLDKIKDWWEFKTMYFRIWRRIIEKAMPDTVFCVQVGDWRKKGKYYDLTYYTEKIFEGLELTPIDKVVVSRKKVTKLKVMLPQAKRLGYTVKCHETLLVYKK